MLLQNILGYIRAKKYVKINVFKKGIQKERARVPCLWYIYLLVFHVLMPQFPKKIGDTRFLTDNLFLQCILHFISEIKRKSFLDLQKYPLYPFMFSKKDM
jgi:hypothetical protein